MCSGPRTWRARTSRRVDSLGRRFTCCQADIRVPVDMQRRNQPALRRSRLKPPAEPRAKPWAAHSARLRLTEVIAATTNGRTASHSVGDVLRRAERSTRTPHRNVEGSIRGGRHTNAAAARRLCPRQRRGHREDVPGQDMQRPRPRPRAPCPATSSSISTSNWFASPTSIRAAWASSATAAIAARRPPERVAQRRAGHRRVLLCATQGQSGSRRAESARGPLHPDDETTMPGTSAGPPRTARTRWPGRSR